MVEPGIHPGMPDYKTHFLLLISHYHLCWKGHQSNISLWLIAVHHGVDPSWSSYKLSSVPGRLEVFDKYQELSSLHLPKNASSFRERRLCQMAQIHGQRDSDGEGVHRA